MEREEQEIKRTNYRPHHHSIGADLSVGIPCTIYGGNEEGFSTISDARLRISIDDDRYPFWRWIIRHPEYQRSITDEDLTEANYRFLFETGHTQLPASDEGD